jgi:hypothetical protein
VLLAATLAPLWIAITVAVASTLSFNYFFFPPVGTFTIAEPHNWVSLFAFLVRRSSAATCRRPRRSARDSPSSARISRRTRSRRDRSGSAASWPRRCWLAQPRSQDAADRRSAMAVDNLADDLPIESGARRPMPRTPS